MNIVNVKLLHQQAVEACRFEKPRFTQIVDIGLIDGGEVVSLTNRPPFAHRKIAGTHFY
jgi:hypothetical protein